MILGTVLSIVRDRLVWWYSGGNDCYLCECDEGRVHQGLHGLTPERVYHHDTTDTLVPAIVRRSASLSAPLNW